MEAGDGAGGVKSKIDGQGAHPRKTQNSNHRSTLRSDIGSKKTRTGVERVICRGYGRERS